jgi:hypothetical protein
MASIFQNSGPLTLHTQQAVDYFLKPVYQNEDIRSLFRLRTNVVSSTQLNLPGTMEKVLKKRTDCGQDTAGTLTVADRELAVTQLYMNITQCADDFDGTFMEELRNTGKDLGDLSTTEIMTSIIVPILMEGIMQDIYRFATLGDTGSADADYNAMDGVWKLVIDAAGNVAITENNAGVGASDALPADAAEAYLEAVWLGADNTLKQQPRNAKAFHVSGSIFDNYYNTLAAKDSTESGFAMQTAGVSDQGAGLERLYFRGIPVIPHRTWDRLIVADQSGVSQHRILYTTTPSSRAGNWFIGTDESDVNLGLEVWYDKDEDVNRMRSRLKIGVQYAYAELFKSAY